MDTDKTQDGFDSVRSLSSSVTSVSSVSSVATLPPLPALPIVVRPATPADLPFIDALQKLHTKQVGWMPTKSLEGKIEAGDVLVAEGDGRRETGDGRKGADASAHEPPSPVSSLPSPLGYLIGADRYFKRDDVGIIYAINVVPGAQRGLIGATLLKAQFQRSAYGCKLYCCWCAQDLAANRFWEAMGFVPLAFRTGGKARTPQLAAKSESALLQAASCKPQARTHIFWQKRIQQGDASTPWWFPSKTDGGALREDRLVLPIPPGVHWGDEMPTLLPGLGKVSGPPQLAPPAMPRLPGTKGGSTTRATPAKRASAQFGPPGATPIVAIEAPVPAESRPRRSAPRCDPRHVAAARELRDRWLEQVNAGSSHALKARAKYAIDRSTGAALLMIDAMPMGPALPAPLVA